MERRTFIKSSAALAGSLILPVGAHANEPKIKLAILGMGWWGTDSLLSSALASGRYEIAALCDVNREVLDRAAKVVVDAGLKKPQLFSAYREMYKMEGLQAVAIATPTHWHALQFIDACWAGLHVFLEKPICYDIREGQAMLAAQQKANNVVVVDFPRTLLDTNDQVKAFINSGEAGKIRQVQANIHYPEGDLEEKEVPKTLDFETFCGPAPKQKFLCLGNANTPFWRSQHDFSRGVMADWGIHYLHNVRKVLGLDLPDQVSATGGIAKKTLQDNPDHLEVRYDFGGLPVYWSHKSWGYTSPLPSHNIGIYYYGEKATIFEGDLGWEVYTAKGEKIVNGDIVFNPGDPKQGEIYGQVMVNLFKQFAEGIKAKSNKGIANQLDDAFKTTATTIYGDLAYLTRANLQIDPASLNIKNHKEAQAMLKRGYRKPYQHPYSLP
ncbi:MAG: Gfo/Idh/MocA family oxidoreductase [Bernardetiaceae bacterium]|jgi:predicted dehydrogenase|nr:Gfo/Idh/MocA family oxidoreductase [Bernardetiaceae bacterium]